MVIVMIRHTYDWMLTELLLNSGYTKNWLSKYLGIVIAELNSGLCLSEKNNISQSLYLKVEELFNLHHSIK